MKTYAKYNRDKNRTISVFYNGNQRFISIFDVGNRVQSDTYGPTTPKGVKTPYCRESSELVLHEGNLVCDYGKYSVGPELAWLFDTEAEATQFYQEKLMNKIKTYGGW